MRAAMVAVTAITLMSSVAVADDIQDAQRQAVAGRDSYWNCLGKEYRRIIDEHKSGQDVAPAIGSACPSERQNFRVMLVDYLVMKFPDIDAGSHLTTANNAIELAQKDIVTAYNRKKVDQK